jgi:hypothetical protein
MATSTLNQAYINIEVLDSFYKAQKSQSFFYNEQLKQSQRTIKSQNDLIKEFEKYGVCHKTVRVKVGFLKWEKKDMVVPCDSL